MNYFLGEVQSVSHFTELHFMGKVLLGLHGAFSFSKARGHFGEAAQVSSSFASSFFNSRIFIWKFQCTNANKNNYKLQFICIRTRQHHIIFQNVSVAKY